MKLRNKNTGDPVKFVSIESIYKDKLKLTYILSSGLVNERYYTSIEKFNEDWEDYKPKEPLIKDEKIRKVVRAWAEANGISQVQFDSYTSGFSASDAGHNLLSMISFDGFVFNCVDGKIYTVAELCGEEEE